MEEDFFLKNMKGVKPFKKSLSTVESYIEIEQLLQEIAEMEINNVKENRTLQVA